MRGCNCHSLSPSGTGDSTYGQLNVPSGLPGVTQVSTGLQHVCALKDDGTVTCWGARLPAVYMQATSAIGLHALLCVSPDVQQQHRSAGPLLQATTVGAKRPCPTICHLSDRLRQVDPPAFSLRVRRRRNRARISPSLFMPIPGAAPAADTRRQYVELQRCLLSIADTPRPRQSLHFWQLSPATRLIY